MEYMHSLFDDENVVKAVTDIVWQSGWWTELDRNAIPEEEVFKKLREAAGDQIDNFNIAMDRFGELIQRTDFAVPWVDELKEKGYKVFFLSNYSDFIVRKNPEALDFIDHMG